MTHKHRETCEHFLMFLFLLQSAIVRIFLIFGIGIRNRIHATQVYSSPDLMEAKYSINKLSLVEVENASIFAM
jgi:hypothetical protein